MHDYTCIYVDNPNLYNQGQNWSRIRDHNRKWIFEYKKWIFSLSVEEDVTKRLSMITCINNLSPATLMVFYPAV